MDEGLDAALAALRIDDNAPEELMKEIAHRISACSANALAAIVALTETNDPFLSDEGFAANSLFNRRWPPSLDISNNQSAMNAFIALTAIAREKDGRLQRCADKLVPRKATELEFWRRYAGHVATILQSLSPTPREMMLNHLATLPPRRPVEERLHAPADKLQMSGTMKKADILHFLTSCKKVRTSLRLRHGMAC